MTTHSEQTNKPLTPSESASVQKAQTVHRNPWAAIGMLFSACAFVIIIAGIYFALYHLIDANKKLTQHVNVVENKLAQEQTDLQKNLIDMQQTLQQTHDGFVNQQTVLSEIRDAQQGKKELWQILEAQYLTNLANDNLQVGDNLTLVIKLLQSADQNISNVPDPNLLPVRKALATDISALQNIQPVDVNGIYLRLSALKDQIDKLPIVGIKSGDVQVQQAEVIPDKTWWQRGLHQSWQALRQLVVVRYNASGARPFISPDQEVFLRQNLTAMLSQAMTALVHKQGDIYAASLNQASAWIKQYFIQDSPVTTAALTNLHELSAIVIHPELPTLAASLQAFHDFQAQTAPNAPVQP